MASKFALYADHLAGAGGPAGAQTAAVPVSRFLGSLGVDTHVAQGYDYTKYVPALRYLGVRAVRNFNRQRPQSRGAAPEDRGPDRYPECRRSTGPAARGPRIGGRRRPAELRGRQRTEQFPHHLQRPDRRRLRLVGSRGQLPAGPLCQREGRRRPESLSGVPRVGGRRRGRQRRHAMAHDPRRRRNHDAEGTKYADYANPHNYVIGNCHQIRRQPGLAGGGPDIEQLLGRNGRRVQPHLAAKASQDTRSPSFRTFPG